MAIVAVSISPTGSTPEEGVSVSRYVARALQVVQAQEAVRYRLDPMFTTLEGDLDQIFALVRRMQEAVFDAGALRVGTVLKIDDRRDCSPSMEDKVRSVEEQLKCLVGRRARTDSLLELLEHWKLYSTVMYSTVMNTEYCIYLYGLIIKI